METKETLAREIERALDGKNLLEHPFYQRWQNGELSADELKEYSEQYRYFEAQLPDYLRSILGKLSEGPAADYIRDNLNDEAGESGTSHLDLFSTFLAASGGSSKAVATPATAALIDAYSELVVNDNASAAIAGLIAYESQASAVADTKGDGLREHYGYDSEGTAFWDLHATLDVEHAEWATEALVAAGATADDTYRGASKIADAWWNFLTERNGAHSC